MLSARGPKQSRTKMSYDLAEHLRVSAELLEHDESFATVTLLAIRGSAPQIAGAKAIVTDQGIVAGTVGGGKIENAAIEYAKKTLSKFDGQTTVVEPGISRHRSA